MASLYRASAKRYRSTVEGRSRVARSMRNAVHLDVFLQPVQVAADEGRAIPRNHSFAARHLDQMRDPGAFRGVDAGFLLVVDHRAVARQQEQLVASRSSPTELVHRYS